MNIDLRTVEGLAEPPGYAHVAVAPGLALVFTAGAVPLDEAGELVGPDDAEAQTEQVDREPAATARGRRRLARRRREDHVYVAGASHETQGAVWKVVQRSPLAPVPSTLVGVALLGYRGQLVEIEADRRHRRLSCGVVGYALRHHDERGAHMQAPKKIADAGKEAGKKVLATDTAQGVVEAVVDKLEEIAVDKADDVAATVKDRAAKAGGRAPEAFHGQEVERARSRAAKKSSAKKPTREEEADGQEDQPTKKKPSRQEEASGQEVERQEEEAASRKPAARKKSTAKKR